VVAVRQAIDLQRARSGVDAAASVSRLVATAASPELQLLRSRYRPLLREALSGAMRRRAVDAHELRQHLDDSLGSNAPSHIDDERISSPLVDDGQALQLLPVGAGVEDEVVGPDLVASVAGSGRGQFLEDPQLPVHNNASDRPLRREIVGRTNWLVVGSDEAGEVNAAFVSLLASCLLHCIEPWAYLRDLLTLLPRRPPLSRVLELAPVSWRQTLDQEDAQRRLGRRRLPRAPLDLHPAIK
jgi:hypothetical protein